MKKQIGLLVWWRIPYMNSVEYLLVNVIKRSIDENKLDLLLIITPYWLKSSPSNSFLPHSICHLNLSASWTCKKNFLLIPLSYDPTHDISLIASIEHRFGVFKKMGKPTTKPDISHILYARLQSTNYRCFSKSRDILANIITSDKETYTNR